MPASDSLVENRMTNCRACGYPTLGSDVCAPCAPLVAAAEGAVATPLAAFSPAA